MGVIQLIRCLIINHIRIVSHPPKNKLEFSLANSFCFKQDPIFNQWNGARHLEKEMGLFEYYE